MAHLNVWGWSAAELDLERARGLIDAYVALGQLVGLDLVSIGWLDRSAGNRRTLRSRDVGELKGRWHELSSVESDLKGAAGGDSGFAVTRMGSATNLFFDVRADVLSIGEPLVDALIEVYVAADATSGRVHYGSEVDPFLGLGYVTELHNHVAKISGYGWLTVLSDSHLQALGGFDRVRRRFPGTVHRRSTASQEIVVLQARSGPIVAQEDLDAVDAFIMPIRSERAQWSKGNARPEDLQSLSTLDRALAFANSWPPPDGHPDTGAPSSLALAKRNRKWPAPCHRPPLEWYQSGEPPPGIET